ncbi:hypothetical protein VTK56DRAFT_2080 [Thermocarpiscus australiensis]
MAQNTDSANNDNNSNSCAPVSVEELDPRGDLTLIAGEEKVAFRVCSRSLARSSRFWDTMLYGPFREGRGQQSKEKWEIELPEDNPEGLRIILLVVHSKYSAIPQVLPRSTLFHASVLCDKYDMILIRQLWIAHALGDSKSYMETLWKFMLCTRKYEFSTRIFPEGWREYDLYKDVHLQSLDVLKHLERGRLVLLKEINVRFKRAMANLTQSGPRNCRSQKSPEWQQTCDCAMLGALHRALAAPAHKCWYTPGLEDWADRVTLSVRHMVAKLNTVHRATIEESTMEFRQNGLHAQCVPWVAFTLTDISAAHKLGDLVPLKEEYFQKQAEKSGLKITVVAPPEPGTALPGARLFQFKC